MQWNIIQEWKNKQNTATHKKEIYNHKTEQREPYIIPQYCMVYLQKVQNQVKVGSCDRSQDSYQVSFNFLLFLDPGGDCKSMFKSVKFCWSVYFWLVHFYIYMLYFIK